MAPRNSVAVCGEMPIAAIVPILLAGTYYTGTIEGPLLLYQGKTVQKRGKKNTTLKQGNTQRLTWKTKKEAWSEEYILYFKVFSTHAHGTSRRCTFCLQRQHRLTGWAPQVKRATANCESTWYSTVSSVFVLGLAHTHIGGFAWTNGLGRRVSGDVASSPCEELR